MGYFIIGVIVGSVVATIVYCAIHDRRTVGIISIDHSDEDGPYIFCTLHESVEQLEKRKDAVFDIQTTAYLSQK